MEKDLKIFIDTFEAGKYKELKNGIEIRGNIDIYKAMNLASEIIKKKKLKLSIRHTADMIGYGGFEVLLINE